MLVDGYLGRITDNFPIGQNRVDGHTGLGSPGKCWHEGKSGGILSPSSKHLSSGAHLDNTNKEH